MYKELFNILGELRAELNTMEMELKYVGHGAGAKSGECVNRSLRQLNVFRDSLWAVDKALETERELRQCTNNKRKLKSENHEYHGSEKGAGKNSGRKRSGLGDSIW